MRGRTFAFVALHVLIQHAACQEWVVDEFKNEDGSPFRGIDGPTVIRQGPDLRFYVGAKGAVSALTVDDEYRVSDVCTSKSIGEERTVLGLTFDPRYFREDDIFFYIATSQLNWAGGRHGDPALFPGGWKNGMVQIMRSDQGGHCLAVTKNLVTGLSVSNHDHGVNGMVVDLDGTLKVLNGGMTNAGFSEKGDGDGGSPETPLSGALLTVRHNIDGFNGNVEYDTDDGREADVVNGADVEVFAAGFMNALPREPGERAARGGHTAPGGGGQVVRAPEPQPRSVRQQAVRVSGRRQDGARGDDRVVHQRADRVRQQQARGQVEGRADSGAHRVPRREQRPRQQLRAVPVQPHGGARARGAAAGGRAGRDAGRAQQRGADGLHGARGGGAAHGGGGGRAAAARRDLERAAAARAGGRRQPRVGARALLAARHHGDVRQPRVPRRARGARRAAELPRAGRRARRGRGRVRGHRALVLARARRRLHVHDRAARHAARAPAADARPVTWSESTLGTRTARSRPR
ncbi:hypothetical protein FGB62_45g137 [Gracilaria domingensis]|nr:hypothetical protein FGB62_45g137 [Gracilaria domingensis]